MANSQIQQPLSANEEANLFDTITQAQTQELPHITPQPLLESTSHTVVSPLIHPASTLLASNVGFSAPIGFGESGSSMDIDSSMPELSHPPRRDEFQTSPSPEDSL